MDKTIIDIVSICLGWVGLYGAIKKSNPEEFKTYFDINLQSYKIHVIDDFMNNMSIFLTLLVFLGQLCFKIFENKFCDRMFTNTVYILISAISIGISVFLFYVIKFISKKFGRKEFFKKMKPNLLRILSQIQEIFSKEQNYQKIERHIVFLEDLLDISIKENDLEKRFANIKKIINS